MMPQVGGGSGYMGECAWVGLWVGIALGHQAFGTETLDTGYTACLVCVLTNQLLVVDCRCRHCAV